MKNYIAHQREEDGKEQLVEEHLLQVAQIASEYGEVFGCKEVAYVCGCLMYKPCYLLGICVVTWMSIPHLCGSR